MVADVELQNGPAKAAWQPIGTAPKGQVLLLYGLLHPHPDDAGLHSLLDKPRRVTGYWDEVDQEWAPVGATWLGPWFKPTHWMPLPPPPNP